MFLISKTNKNQVSIRSRKSTESPSGISHSPMRLDLPQFSLERPTPAPSPPLVDITIDRTETYANGNQENEAPPAKKLTRKEQEKADKEAAKAKKKAEKEEAERLEAEEIAKAAKAPKLTKIEQMKADKAAKKKADEEEAARKKAEEEAEEQARIEAEEKAAKEPLNAPSAMEPGVYDYAIADSSDEGDYFPRRGRSPPAPLRYEIKDPSPDNNRFPPPPADSQNRSEEPPSDLFDKRGEEQKAKARSAAEAPRLKEIPLHEKWDEHKERATKYMQAARVRGGAEDEPLNPGVRRAETFAPTGANVRYASPPAQYSDDEAPSASSTQGTTSTTGPFQPPMDSPRSSQTPPAQRQGRWQAPETFNSIFPNEKDKFGTEMGLEATTSTSNPGKSIEDEELDLHQRDASRKPNRYLRMEAISNAEESTEHEELDLRQQAARERNHRLRMEAISNPDESTEHEELDLRQHEAARERNYRLRMEANNAASYKGKEVEVPQSSAEVNFSGTDLSENEETRQTSTSLGTTSEMLKDRAGDTRRKEDPQPIFLPMEHGIKRSSLLTKQQVQEREDSEERMERASLFTKQYVKEWDVKE
jgi:hypothetical protein